jgi:hypothetical protein
MVTTGKNSAAHIADLPSLETENNPEFEVDVATLPTVRNRYPKLLMHRPCQKANYKGPLLLFRQAPKFNRESRGAIWSNDDVAYCFSYYGVPVGQSPIGEYLFVLSYSDLFVYWALLTSAKFGVERETFYVEDISSFPVEPYVQLSDVLREKCRKLADQIRAGECPWVELEEFVKVVYRLSDLDWQLITDALTYASPYSKSLARAAASIDERSGEVVEFAIEMATALNALVDAPFKVQVKSLPSITGWLFVEVSKITENPVDDNWTRQGDISLAKLIENESSFWTTQLRLQVGSGQWLIGQPSEARYWSKSKAQLLALQLQEAGLFSSSAGLG